MTFVVCAGAGLDTGGESMPYVAGWGETGALAAVTEFAGVIDTIAHQLETAITSSQQTTSKQPEPAAAA